eukprot:scaffold8070_cov117-Cylindrotheca_fusiformis.AAC.18
MAPPSAALLRTGRVALRRSKAVGSGQQLQRRWAGDMPVPQSQHAPLWNGHTVKKEGWETSMYVFTALALVLQAAVIGLAPETSIESWARAEAKARLQLQAKDPELKLQFGKHYQDVIKNNQMESWSKFADRSTNPGEDDDEEDEEEDDEE